MQALYATQRQLFLPLTVIPAQAGNHKVEQGMAPVIADLIRNPEVRWQGDTRQHKPTWPVILALRQYPQGGA